MNSFSIVAVWALRGRNSSCCLVRHSIDLLSCSMARCATARDCGPPSFPSGRPLAPISLPSAIACAKCPDYRSARQIPDSNLQACEASADRRVGSPRPRQARTFTSAPSARSRRANEAELAARGAGNGLAGRLRFSSGVTSKLQPVLVETSASSLSILAVEKVMENRRAGVAQAQPATVAPMSGRVAPALRQLRKRTRTALGRSRCTQNEGDHPLVASPMASRMMSTTRPGAVTIGVWSIGCERTRACIRSAINRCVSRTIMRSCSAMRNQVGRSFQSGRFTGAVMHAGEIGR